MGEYPAEQRRHFCCSTKLGKAEHYKLEALKAWGEWIQREGEKSRAQEGGSNWQETPSPPLLLLHSLLLLLHSAACTAQIVSRECTVIQYGAVFPDNQVQVCTGSCLIDIILSV